MNHRETPKEKRKKSSSQTPTQAQDTERGKLIRLVQVWRAKYEKLYAESQGFDSIIKNLESDNAQLKIEKETVGNQLQEKLSREREHAEKKILELKTIADTAAKQNEVETRDLKTKIQRLEQETKPLIDMYRERDEKMKKSVALIKEENNGLLNEIQALTDRQQQSDVDKIGEIAEIKKSHRQKVLQIKLRNCATLAKLSKEAKAETERVKTEAVEQNGKEEEIESINSQHQKEILDLTRILEKSIKDKEKIRQDLTSELFKQKKKIELGRLKLKHKEQRIKTLLQIISDTNGQLSSNRSRRHVIRKTTIPVKELSRQLVVTIREQRGIESALKRIDITKYHFGYMDVDSALKLEVLYTSKTAEISRLKQLIHDKLVDDVYHPRPSKKLVPIKQHREATFGSDELVLLRSDYGSEGSDSFSDENRIDEIPDSPSHGRMKTFDEAKDKDIFHPASRIDRRSWLLSRQEAIYDIEVGRQESDSN